MSTRKRTGWTPSSWECFKNNCNCSRECSNYETCKYIQATYNRKNPPIKAVVEELIDSGVSIPVAVTEYTLNFATNDSVEVLRMWLLDNLNYEEISAKTGITLRGVEERLAIIMQKFESKIVYSRSKRYSDKAEKFRQWATKNLKEELEELERVGILCTQK